MFVGPARRIRISKNQIKEEKGHEKATRFFVLLWVCGYTLIFAGGALAVANPDTIFSGCPSWGSYE